MNYQDKELRQALAAEYVLGTLSGAARKRFEGMLQADAGLRAIVNAWEQKLAPLHEAVAPLSPPPQVWSNIRRRLGLGVTASLGWWHNLTLWRSSATLAMAALVLVVGMQLFTPAVEGQYFAVIQDEQRQASWLAKADLANKQIVIQVINSQPLPSDKSFELWMLPVGGAAPVSMGLIEAVGSSTLHLSDAVLASLATAQGLAVSLEPSGGSPTGSPTGPVLYSGVLTVI